MQRQPLISTLKFEVVDLGGESTKKLVRTLKQADFRPNVEQAKGVALQLVGGSQAARTTAAVLQVSLLAKVGKRPYPLAAGSLMSFRTRDCPILGAKSLGNITKRRGNITPF